jgi:hypothetical protein
MNHPIPESLAGKACAYQTVVGLLQYGDNDTEGLHKKAKAIASTLSPAELQKLELDPTWHDRWLANVAKLRAETRKDAN